MIKAWFFAVRNQVVGILEGVSAPAAWDWFGGGCFVLDDGQNGRRYGVKQQELMEFSPYVYQNE